MALWVAGGAMLQPSSSPIYYKFGIPKINNKYIYELAKLMHKLDTKSLPTPILNHFPPLKIPTKTNIRSKERGSLKIPFFKSARTQKLVKY